MSGLKNKINEFVEPLCREKGVILRGIQFSGREQNITIRIIVDTEEGITLRECQNLSSEISDLFYQKNIVSGRYNLEVSSPGLDRPLQDLFEYRRNIGRNLKVSYQNDSGPSTVIGQLKEVSELNIQIKLEDRELTIPFSKIDSAKIQLKW